MYFGPIGTVTEKNIAAQVLFEMYNILYSDYSVKKKKKFCHHCSSGRFSIVWYLVIVIYINTEWVYSSQQSVLAAFYIQFALT